MKNGLAVMIIAAMAIMGMQPAQAASSDAALEMTLLLQFANEIGIDDYTLIDVIGGYREYRSMMDTYAQQQAEKLAALNAAVANNEADSVISGLTQQLMTLDMDILRLQQSTLDQAASLMDAKALAKLYLMVRDLDQVKADFLAGLSGTKEVTPCDAPVEAAAAPAEAAAAPAETPAPAPAAEAVKPEDAALAKAQEFMSKVAAKDLDGAMVGVSDKFEHYEYGSKEELKSFLDEAKSAGYLDDLKVITDDAEVKIEGDKAVVYPVDVEGLFGSFTLELTCTKEGDTWMLTTMDIFGI